MTYALDIKNNESQEFILIDGEKVVHRMGNNPFLTITRTHLHGFQIQPGRVFFEPSLKDLKTPQERIAAFKSLIQQGATSVVTTSHISDSMPIRRSLAKARHMMINSPIDYIVGATVDIQELTPNLVIDISKHNVPFILFQFEGWNDVYSKAWEWIRDSNMSRRLLFIPQWKSNEPRPREVKKRHAEWLEFAASMNIPTSLPLQTGEPLSLGQIKKIGIYPIKGALRPGADCDYVLYPTLLDDEGPNRYDENTPSIVVIRGKIQLAGQEIFRPGYGRELKIRMPHRFTDYWECMDNNG